MTPLVAPSPAAAADSSSLIGHRCRTYEPDATNENTVAALVQVASVPGAWCEIDTWRIADGTQIVWHDPTWERVADPATLPLGVRPDDRVEDATWAQVREIRTKGGQPVARLGQMIYASAFHGVPLIVEVNNPVNDPQGLVQRAVSWGADVRYYKAPAGNCSTPALDALAEAGAPIGIKINDGSACELAPWELQAKGASFITTVGSDITPAYSARLQARGIELYARWSSLGQISSLLSAGADRVMVDDPLEASRYLEDRRLP